MSRLTSDHKIEEINNRYTRNGNIIIAILMFMGIPTSLLFAYIGSINNLPQLYIISAVLIISIFLDLIPLSLIRKGRSNLAMIMMIFIFIGNILSVPFIVQGLGVILAIATIMVTIAITGLALPPKYSTAGLATGIVFGIIFFGLDSLLGDNRIMVPEIETYSRYIVIAIAIPIFLILLREFNKFSLQIKVTLGILITGGIAVATLTFFGLNRANLIVNDLARKYENSITDQTESEIKKIVQKEAEQADDVFFELTGDLSNIAQYRARLETQNTQFAPGSYWNSSEKLFQLPDGQYGNSGIDAASIFIPSTYLIDEAMLADLNTTAYLDFLIPGFLDTHPEVTAIYYISSLGSTTYYPNINLAQNVPADFDPTQEAFFTIANPLNNPERKPQWTSPYQDPAGAGLILTLSIPVYTNSNIFKGVISADIKLTTITDSISKIKLGETGFSTLVDKNGLILSMPSQGYTLFDLQPELIPMNENAKQTIAGRGPQELQPVIGNILEGETDLVTLTLNGIETYVAYIPLEITGYRLILFAPANELNEKILVSRNEIREQVDASLQNAAIILMSLFIGALIASIWAGRIITNPLKRLTNSVEQITSNNLSARINVESQDEIGTLANSFNSMADRLSNTLTGLEERIAERTIELEKTNESNAYRASQFESIAKISRIISSTQTLNELLPQISVTISEQLGFYHVGIFLLDARKEYAILVAANSPGGKTMLDRNHRLQVGEKGIVGFVTKSGQPRVALNVGLDAVYFNNPDLPETHSEIALPLRIGTEIFGALDVQSTNTNAFKQEDVNILSTLADQVSVAIQNARSYQQSLEALAKAESVASQMGERQWKQFLNTQTAESYFFDGIEAKQLTTSYNKQAHNLAIPLILRGTQIGTLKLSAPDPGRIWTEDEIAMAQATADRTALAIENARLLQEAQKRASKEKTIGQISAKIGSLVNIETIIKTTIQELGDTLPGTDIAIQFKKNQETK